MTTESRACTGEFPESFIPIGHPVLYCLPRGEIGQVLGFHKPIKGLPMTAGEPARSGEAGGTRALSFVHHCQGAGKTSG